MLLKYKRFFITLLIILIALSFTLPYGVTAYRTAFIVSRIIPAVPEWFNVGSYEVEESVVRFSQEEHLIDIYRPKGVAKVPFFLFLPGFTPEGSRDFRLVTVANALAGAGIGAAILDSENTKQKRISRDDIDLIKNAFSFLREQSYVYEDQIAIGGFSLAGSYVLRAASELGDDPLFILSFGAYYNPQEAIAEIISKKAVFEGKERLWEPDSVANEFVRNLIEQLPKEISNNLFLQKEISYKEVKQMLTLLPKDFQDLMVNISPSATLADMKTRVFLMHDINDGISPVEDSRKIRDGLPSNIPVSYGEFSLIRHVTPKTNTFFSTDLIRFSKEIFTMVKLLSQRP